MIHIPRAFISYSSVDEELAMQVEQDLEELGIHLFLDKKVIELGDNFHAKISSELRRATDLVLIASPSSVKSTWVAYEIGQAVAFGCRIITLLSHPGVELPAFVADFQFANDVAEIERYFQRKLEAVSAPLGLAISKDSNTSFEDCPALGPTPELTEFIEKFPPSWFDGHIAVDGAIELHTFPSNGNPYGGIYSEQLTTIDSGVEWSELAKSDLSDAAIMYLGNNLRRWIGNRRAKPNRIRFLAEAPAQMVLDNNEYQICVGNSDYFSMRTVANLSESGRKKVDNNGIDRVFSNWWEEPNKRFRGTTTPYHVSAQGILIVTDPKSRLRSLILTLPSRQRKPLVTGWNTTFAEQMWAPTISTAALPWWMSYVDGLSIEDPSDRTGDIDLWNTVERGLAEELGIKQSDLIERPKLVASCIEHEVHFVTYIFVLTASLSMAELQSRRLAAPDKEIGSIAAYPLEGTDESGQHLDPLEQFALLLEMDSFNGGPYLVPQPSLSAVEGWHSSSRYRIYVAARHLLGAAINERIRFQPHQN